jgi:3-oxoadipate enol-lactonase
MHAPFMTAPRPPTGNPDNPLKVSDTVPGAQDAGSPREIQFECDGTRLFAVETGQGPPVVFIHGGLADHRAALFRLAPLAATHRLITPDLRGSGRSHYGGELSWDRLADDLAALLTHLEIESAVVGGTSMGSAVALRFALRHPRRLRALILMSPLYPGADRPLAEAASAAMRVMAEAGQRTAEHGVDALRSLFEALPDPVRDIAIEMALSFDPQSVAATTRFLATNAQPMSTARELEALGVPVLILPGIDPEHPAEVAQLYARYLRFPVVVEQTEVSWMERIAAFCSGSATG